MRLCVQWPRFGPYHLARLRAAHGTLEPRGVEVIGLETASNDALYEWRLEDAPEPFRREQVFPGRVFEEVSPSEMHAGTFDALDRIDPDVVGIMSYGFPDARAAVEWCRRRRRVAVLMTDTKADDAERIGWRERIKRVIVDQYDAALVAGSPQRAYLRALGFPEDLIFDGYAAVDNAYFAAESEVIRDCPERADHLPGLADPAPFFLAINRFLPFKNLHRLLDAYAEYRRHAESVGHIPWRLVLVGDGPGRADLEAHISRDQIEGVVLAGFRQVDELPAYFALAGALVHPTLKDTWGLVVNEAMAAGLPVLVSDRAGCAPDLVLDGETGFRFDPLDSHRLASLMGQIAAPGFDREAMGHAARRHIEADYSPARFAEQLWRAAEAGRDRAQRPFGIAPRLILGAVRVLSRDATSFHTAEL